MKRPITLIFVAILVAAMLAGCAGNIIVVQMPTEAEDTTPVHTPAGDDAVKTGLAVFTSVSDSTSAVEGTEGEIKYDITLAAVTVDDNGVIHSARIDSIPATLTMDNTGNITSNLTAEIPTKNELGADYGMVAWGGAVAEWDEQVAALCDYAVGKTIDELKNGAIDESGKAPAGSDLATSATIYLGGYVNALEAAVNNAKHLGASGGDKLSLVTINSLTKSTAATAEEAGLRQGLSVIDSYLMPLSAEVMQENGRDILSGRCRVHLTLCDEAGEISSQEVELPYRYEAETKDGALADYLVHVSPISCRARADGERLGIDGELAVSLLTRAQTQIQYLSACNIGEKCQKPEGECTVCFPASDDTLWSVAKRYHKPLSHLTGINTLPSQAQAAAADSTASLAGVNYLLV